MVKIADHDLATNGLHASDLTVLHAQATFFFSLRVGKLKGLARYSSVKESWWLLIIAILE